MLFTLTKSSIYPKLSLARKVLPRLQKWLEVDGKLCLNGTFTAHIPRSPSVTIRDLLGRMNHCHETSSSDIQALSALVTCKLITRPLDELHPHPSYARHCVTVPISKLSALAERSDLAFQEPIRITRDGIIIDGYARVELARQLGRTELLCLEYDLSETESLQEMLEAHQSSRGFNAFQRTVLALDLESEFQEQARSHQRGWP